MVGPNPLRVLRRNQTHEWVSLRTHENEGKKKSPNYQGQKSLGSPVVRTGPGYLGTAKSSGSLGQAAKLGLD